MSSRSGGVRDAADQEGQPEYRNDREQSIGCVKGMRGEFAEHDIDSFQIGEKQRKRQVPFLREASRSSRSTIGSVVMPQRL